MPKPIPHSLEGSLPTQGPGFDAADAMRVHEGIGLPGEESLDRMGESEANQEIKNLIWERAIDSHEKTSRLFSFVIGLEVPELNKFVEAGVDFAKLQAGYEAYWLAGMEPELVLAPVDLSEAVWRSIYGYLQGHQSVHFPDSDFRLMSINGDDGLFIDKNVSEAWEALSQQAVTQTPGTNIRTGDGITWRALVVPTASPAQHGLATMTRHDLTKAGKDLNYQAKTIDPGRSQPIGWKEAHMPVGVYLTLQASRLLEDAAVTDSNNYRTWVAGIFSDSTSAQFNAAEARWSTPRGQVLVNSQSHEVYFSTHTGVRLPVWG